MDTSKMSLDEKRQLNAEIEEELRQEDEKNLEQVFKKTNGKCYVGHFGGLFKVVGKHYSLKTEEVTFEGGNQFHGFRSFGISQGTISPDELMPEGKPSPAYREISNADYERMKTAKTLDTKYEK